MVDLEMTINEFLDLAFPKNAHHIVMEDIANIAMGRLNRSERAEVYAYLLEVYKENEDLDPTRLGRSADPV